ncbi:unnamed protein product [Bursaphelenchus okinawaensis]|uniref:CWH43-like N-terminal domain-containing protein n=1 Tax=Bursaphelenchus okinawaensis TaxID=465554 RepID=A0A811KMT0_9BILA|nr:unnamed protein product [Bursaphelenchus okinawaensis]CAG9106847.1 unnamed protein product [Bursaphelenchus okinawaensis]
MATEDELIRIPFKKIVYYISGLPFFGLAFCVIYSFLFHFEAANATHCGVPNWLPSISAAVAKLEPERYVWRIAIGLHCAPRIVLAVAFRNFLVISPLRSLNTTFLNVMANIGCFVNLAEILFLLMLSSISSGDNYAMHKLSFIGFLVCGFVYMLISIFLFDYSGRRRTVSVGEKSYQYKIFCCGASFISLFFALYFFYRHNTYCEPGIYTFFALAEYGVVIFNILFHSTLYYDFFDRHFSIISGGFSASSYQMLPMHRDD